ncbi:hypothetical protein E2542_SST29169 [Spatholobus suberectus]|nr:hypothetical protein E2542_SST29169 [Spatholobus suberectus]
MTTSTMKKGMDEEYEEEERMVGLKALKVKQMEALMEEVFEAVSSMKRAYVRLQEAHSPWDAERMRAADVAVVAELRKLAVLRERFRRSGDWRRQEEGEEERRRRRWGGVGERGGGAVRGGGGGAEEGGEGQGFGGEESEREA